ncbi:MAG: terpene cyclase/mutase family protein [Planctomycetes bacterium]|nr:terpene cyclase/mutase family protein [Planctomycetota bacterium]
MTKRRKRDWGTPILLTLSVHLMAFTLFINHRLFSLWEEPRKGDFVTQLGGIEGVDPNDAKEKDEGAAPGPAAEEVQPSSASVSEMMREDDQPQPQPLPERTKPVENATQSAATDTRPLSERLAANAGGSGSATVGQSPATLPGGGATGSRGQSRRADGLRKHGGGSDTEDAVEMGLAWLAKVQDHDGRWDSDGYMTHYLPGAPQHERMAEGVGMARNDVGITALCLLAFTGAGHDHLEGKYAGTVKAARDWLLSRQRADDGGFGLPTDTYRPTFYGHAIATLALCDLYMLTGDEKLRTPVQRAVNYLCDCQGDGGGWDYAQRYPGDTRWNRPERDDLSISGWAMLALTAAREAGLKVPVDSLVKLAGLMREATRKDGEAIYADQGVREFHRGMGMLAVSNLSRRLLGEAGDSPMQTRQRERMSATPPNWKAASELEGSNMYYWYYGSLALMVGRDADGGEDRWRKWNIELKKTLLPNQNKSGPRRGSFDPGGDYWAQAGGGRLYSTALCVLMLEIYYRYEPEYLRSHARELAPLWE